MADDSRQVIAVEFCRRAEAFAGEAMKLRREAREMRAAAMRLDAHAACLEVAARAITDAIELQAAWDLVSSAGDG